MRNPGLPKVAIFGVKSLDDLPPKEQLRSHHAEAYEADEFSISIFPDDSGSGKKRIPTELEPQAIVNVAVMLESFSKLLAAPYYIRRKWIHKNTIGELRGLDIFYCFLIAAVPRRAVLRRRAKKKISVFTPVYNTGRDKLLRAYLIFCCKHNRTRIGNG